MIYKREILEFIAERTRKEKSTGFERISEEFDLEPAGACTHLKRLWQERLIRARGVRPPKYKYRLQFGESIRDLRFRLTSRGRERLDWFEEQDEEEELFL